MTVTEELGPDLENILTTVLGLSYDNAKVTIDLRRTSNLPNILRRTRKAFLRQDFLAKSQDRRR